MTTRAPRVWLVAVPGFVFTPDTEGKAVMQGWETIHADCVRLASERGRVGDVVQRGDAIRLYEDMHRRPIAVIYSGKPRVRLDPRPPLRDDRTLSLLQFCRYKAFAVSIRSNEAATWDADFAEWLTRVECDGPSDPRILAFHIFRARGKYELDDSAERGRFRRVHQHRGALVDKLKRRWVSARPGARHGRDPQTVRGLRLEDGFHWDVTTSGSPVLTTPNTAWNVGSGGYINVYPDGHARVGRQCKQTWSAKQSSALDRADLERSRPRK